MLLEKYVQILHCFAVFSLLLQEVHSRDTDSKMSKFIGVDFEVFGRVQGVFFRKFTQKRGQELGLKGWCMNTDKGTVVGRLEGEKAKIEEMCGRILIGAKKHFCYRKHWLRYTGSPQSAIDKAEFLNETEIPELSFTEFNIKK